MKLNVPVGISDFTEIRENGFYYVDKTEMIAELISDRSAAVRLITRPRRFGKTLGMSMLASFFDISRDSSELFSGLKISDNADICLEWQNKWPVVMLTLKNIDGLTFESAFGQICMEISDLCKKYAFLLECDNIDADDKKIFTELKSGTASEANIRRSLSIIIRMMRIYYNKQVIFLLDEYDVPAAKASANGYYDQMLDVVKSMMITSLKDNEDIRMALITGCLRIAKESIFTGMNNFVTDGILRPSLNEYFGFTQNEVDAVLKDAGATAHADDVKVWYDGYRFGDADIYCPWDVMNYIRDIQRDPNALPVSYWKNTSGNDIIRSFIDYSGSNITQKLETLLSGGYIIQRIDDDLTYDYLHSSEDNLWSILYLTGYLTTAGSSCIRGAYIPDGMAALVIPNAEVKDIFETVIIKWFQQSAQTWDRSALFDAVWSGDSETLTDIITNLLRRTISYHDYREDFYNAFIAGIFTGAGYMVKSNREHGEGRSDIVVYDILNARVAIFEAKYADKLSSMEAACDEAIAQIDTKMYATEFEDDYDSILFYGISFFKKRCTVKLK